MHFCFSKETEKHLPKCNMPMGFGQSAQASLPVRPGRTVKETLFEEFRESLDTIDVVGCAARFSATVHSQDGIAHIDTAHGN